MKAAKEMRDAVFSKLDCYVEDLNDMGLTEEWKNIQGHSSRMYLQNGQSWDR
jgi:hypothetical protein